MRLKADSTRWGPSEIIESPPADNVVTERMKIPIKYSHSLYVESKDLKVGRRRCLTKDQLVEGVIKYISSKDLGSQYFLTEVVFKK